MSDIFIKGNILEETLKKYQNTENINNDLQNCIIIAKMFNILTIIVMN